MTPTRCLIPFAVAGLLVLAGCSGSSKSSSSPSSGSGVLVGAGSSLVAPIVSKWSADYAKKHGVTVTYGPIGSGGGIAQITADTVDFGASDAPLSPDQTKEAKNVVQIPWALAATLVAYNVKGTPKNLKLTGPVVADIYLGKIKAWNDPAIVKLNPGATLPATAITPVYRSDSSGDTYAFTDYLGAVSPSWKSKVGTGTAVSFPTGIGGKGNSGVGGVLSQQDGTIAYVAISYVFASNFDYALLRNAAGAYPDPKNATTISAAAATASFGSGTTASIVNPPPSAAKAYPLSTFTYALVHRGSSKAAALEAFLTYAIGDGQQFGKELSFAPLSPAVLATDRKAIASIG